MRENHGVVKYKGVEYAFGGLESALGEARNANDLLIALYRTGFMSQNNVIEELALLVAGQQRDFPMTINQPTC